MFSWQPAKVRVTKEEACHTFGIPSRFGHYYLVLKHAKIPFIYLFFFFTCSLLFGCARRIIDSRGRTASLSRNEDISTRILIDKAFFSLSERFSFSNYKKKKKKSETRKISVAGKYERRSNLSRQTSITVNCVIIRVRSK